MLKKIIAYSLVAVLLGIALILVPILLILSFSTITAREHFVNMTENSEKTTFTANITRGLSINELSEIAQSYGRFEIMTAKSNGITSGLSTLIPSTILIPLVILASAGLFSALAVKLIVSRLYSD